VVICFIVRRIGTGGGKQTRHLLPPPLPEILKIEEKMELYKIILIQIESIFKKLFHPEYSRTVSKNNRKWLEHKL
jgi:hypothetical protein